MSPDSAIQLHAGLGHPGRGGGTPLPHYLPHVTAVYPPLMLHVKSKGETGRGGGQTPGKFVVLAHSARMGPSCRYLAVALALFVALDPGLGGAPLPSKPTCRHGTPGQDLLVLRETLRGGRPSRDSARGSEEIRCASPSFMMQWSR